MPAISKASTLRSISRSVSRSVSITAFHCVGLMLALAAPAAFAQNDATGYDQLDWTGRPENSTIARKEAGAALVEGRRECARKRDDRQACLKKVQEDYTEMLKRAGAGKDKR